MPRRVTDTVPCRPETKDLIKERKPDGMEYDLWLRRNALGLEE